MDRATAALAVRPVLGPDAVGRILSYLPVADHLAAAEVCAEWRDVVFSRQHAARSLGLPVRDEAAVRAAAESAQLPAHVLAALHSPAPAAGWHEEFFESQHLWKLPGSDDAVFFVGAPGGNRAVVGAQHFPRVAPLKRCCAAARRRNVPLAERQQCAAELGTARRRGQVLVPWVGVSYAAAAATERGEDTAAAAAAAAGAAAGGFSGSTAAATLAGGVAAAVSGATAAPATGGVTPAAPAPAATGVGIPVIGAQLVQYYEATVGPAPVFSDPSKGKAAGSAGAASATAAGTGPPPTAPPVGLDVAKYSENQKLWTRAGAVAAGFRFAPAPCVAVGICTKRFPLSRRMPGWCHNSFAYHGDDGSKFHGSGSGSEYGDVFGPGDTVGCGIVYWGASPSGPQKAPAPAAAAQQPTPPALAAAAAPKTRLITGTSARAARTGGAPAASAGFPSAAATPTAARSASTTSTSSDLYDLNGAPATPFVFFTRNGEYLGPAFASVDVSRAWYPAVGIDAPFTITPNFGGVTASGVVRPFVFDLPRFCHAVWSRAVVPPPPLISSLRQLQLPAVVIPATTAGGGTTDSSGVDASVDSNLADDSNDDDGRTSSGSEDDDSSSTGSARAAHARPAKRPRRSIASVDGLDDDDDDSGTDARHADGPRDSMVITLAPPPQSVLAASRSGSARRAKPSAGKGHGARADSSACAAEDADVSSTSEPADAALPVGERFAAADCACSSLRGRSALHAVTSTQCAVALGANPCVAASTVLAAVARRSTFARFCKMLEATADVAAAAIAPDTASRADAGVDNERDQSAASDSKTAEDARHSDSKDSDLDEDEHDRPRAGAAAGGLSLAPKPPAPRGAAGRLSASSGDAVLGSAAAAGATSGIKRRRPSSTAAAPNPPSAPAPAAGPRASGLPCSAAAGDATTRTLTAASALTAGEAGAAGSAFARSSRAAASSARRGDGEDEASSDEDEKGWALRVEPSRVLPAGGDDDVLLPEGSERQRAAHLALIDFYRMLVMQHPDGLMHGLDALDDDFDQEDGEEDSDGDDSDAWDDEDEDSDSGGEDEDDGGDDGEGAREGEAATPAPAAGEAPPPDAGAEDSDDAGGDGDA